MIRILDLFFHRTRAALGVAVLLPVFVTVGSAQTGPQWTQKSPQTTPPPRGEDAMAYDSAHNQIVMFGGFFPVKGFNDTWVWDGSNWTEKSPPHSPSLRFAHAMAYDSAHGQVVLFGGVDATPNVNPLSMNDIWVWDGADWAEKRPTTFPPPRSAPGIAYDPAHGQVVLFGGEALDPTNNGENFFGDTWVWDGSNFTNKSPSNSPSMRAGAAMAYDSARNQVVLFGGSIIDYTPTGAQTPTYNDTWVWDGSNWTQKFPATSPPARSGHSMAYDSALGQIVVFGGGGETATLNDTWVWDGSNWTQTTSAVAPSARGNYSMAYDSAHGQVVLFGGETDTQTLGDTWIWSGGAPPAPAISAVVNGASFVGGGVVPGEIATAFGTNLTAGVGINLTSSLPLPGVFLNNSVIINNQPVALFAVDNVNGQQQINFQVPWKVASGPNANVAIVNNGTTGASISVPVLAAQPGIFNYSVGGEAFGAILHANFQLADTAHPAKAPEIVLIYCTGLGAVSSPPADGEPGKGQPTTTTPTVTVGGARAIVSFSGLAPGFVGLYQINAEIPAGLTKGNQPVVVTLAGTSSNSVLLPVQ